MLLEKMTSILAGPGSNFPQHQKGYMPPIPAFHAGRKTKSRSKSADRAEDRPGKKRTTVSQNHLKPRNIFEEKRKRENRRIAEENETFLKRLQEQGSHYNVYEWEQSRKDEIKRVKNICYYPPSIIKKRMKRGRKSTRRHTSNGYDSANEPNKALYDLY